MPIRIRLEADAPIDFAGRLDCDGETALDDDDNEFVVDVKAVADDVDAEAVGAFPWSLVVTLESF